ncbi:MAG: phenylalanine--tRNA ligase subunit beta [Lachnospiraceae bacterium]|nr:phenylalanine--tRNA ligase subunit beta [Lachnospiraceae bacterium]
MNTPLSWIKAYVPDLDCTAKEYMDALTLTGTKVEGYEKLDDGLEKIVVGKIVKIDRHPDADKLVVCQVQVDEEGTVIQIVTGAPNVFEGAIIPVVLDGGRVAKDHSGNRIPGGVKIKKGKLRGVESFGMMCSIEELGSSTDMYPDACADGIYIFNDNPEYGKTKLGSDVPTLLGLRDVNFEYEVTSNRVDCFSVTGIAREAAATFRKPFCPPQVKMVGNDEKAEDYVSVEVVDKDLCPRYVARVVKNIRLAPSPEWMQRRLAACGIRPINNIVDITNYVMEEYGQPMHAFDLDTIAGNKIIVRRAEAGEKFTTLDGQERVMDENVLMICDAEKPVGIAGIMGGENSKITDDVKTMLFEAACFDGTNIRLSGKRLGMRTDAQAKFEKGLDPENAMEAINRACQLIEELDAGDVVGGCVDVYSSKPEPKVVPYDVNRINRLLGTDISEDEMVSYFEMVDLVVDRDKKEVTVPTWRQDVLLMADLAEEVARFYGYDKIPTTLPTGEATTGGLSYKLTIEANVRNTAEYLGFSEASTYSFESPKVFDKLLVAEDDSVRNAITISNPLGEDYSIMRTLPINGLLTSLATNYNRRNKDVRLYEMANIYIPKELPLTELPDERMQIVLGMYGKCDFYDMKGVVETILYKTRLRNKTVYSTENKKSFLHPGRQAEVIYDGVVLGYIGEVHPEVLDNYGIKEKTYLAVLDIKNVMEHAVFDFKYKGIPKYPAVTRDISLVMDKEVPAGSVEEVIAKKGGKLLEKYELFDVYEGDRLEAGKKSLAYSIRFRDAEKTLEDGEVNLVMDKILAGLKEIGAELRS